MAKISPSENSQDLPQEGVLTFGVHRLRLWKMGKGQEIIVAFHGFSQDGLAFNILARHIGSQFTIIAIDFPGSDISLWNDTQPPDYPQMSFFIHKICEDFKIDKVSLMGFSMGGRIAMSLVPYLPQKINHLYLLAPDGMTRNIWYYLATRNIFGKVFFKKMMNHPDKWVRILFKLAELKIIKEGWRKIAQNTLNNSDLRRRTLMDWPFTKNFIPNPQSVKKVLNRNGIPLDLFMGEMDTVFPIKEGTHFLKGIHQGNLHAIHCGHHLLQNGNVELVAKIMLRS